MEFVLMLWSFVGWGIALYLAIYGRQLYYTAKECETRRKAAQNECSKHRKNSNEQTTRVTNDYLALETLYNDLQKRHTEIVKCLESSNELSKANADEIVSLNFRLDMLRTSRDNVLAERDNLKNKVIELTDRLGVQFADAVIVRNERDSLKHQLECAKEDYKLACTQRDNITSERDGAAILSRRVRDVSEIVNQAKSKLDAIIAAQGKQDGDPAKSSIGSPHIASGCVETCSISTTYKDKGYGSDRWSE